MRVKSFYRLLRSITYFVLFFFLWSFGPLFQIVAYAATPQGQSSGKQATADNRPPTTGDRFEKALEEIREKVGKAGEKADRVEDDTAEREAIREKKAEIDSLDVELRKEFTATEKKLKDAKLPKEILDRHYKFVKHYEANLSELKANIDGIEKAGTKADRKAKIEKAKAHLEKTKKPSTHQKLDPNRLPHQNRVLKTKWREPRTKEQYERDFPQQKSQSKQKIADSRSWHDLLANAPKQKPILLAFNEFASDIPLSLGAQSATPQLAFSDPSPFLLAQAADAPNAADLAETVEVQFTQDIRDVAAQLGNKPAKIFEWVRNNIEFVPTYGSIQGADMCLQTQQCNSFDTASLLIALLRASNISARYVYGTIEVPIEKVMNWVGGFTDPMAAATLMVSGGIPVKPYIVGSKIAKVQMEHTWVETYIPYGNYRGAIMDQSIKTWIPMDGSYKSYTYTPGFDITGTVPFNQDAYLSQVQSQNPVHYYQSRIQEYLDANMPETSIVDVKGYRDITQEKYHFLPSTLPYIIAAQLGKFSSIPAGMTAKVTFTLSNHATGADASYAASTTELAGKRITVSYVPATVNDEAIIASYGGFLYNVPAYMLNLKPVLRVEGVIKLTGDSATLGSEQALTMQFIQPASRLNEIVRKPIYAGAYYAVGMNLQGVNENVLGKRNYKLNTNVLSETAGTLGNDDLIGEHLFILATTYQLANDKIYKSGAKLYNTVVTRTLSEGITSFTLSVSYLFSIPRRAMPSGINMDVAMDRIIAVAKDGNTTKEKAYMDIAGLVSSYHEHDIFEKIDGFSSVSAVRALQVAGVNGIPIQRINATNIGQMLPMLQVSQEIKTDIRNAINAGKEVTVPQTNVKINDWNGVGYIVKDPLTGSGSYMITGGLAGGDSTSQQDGMQIVQLHKEPYGWVKDRIDPQTRNTIVTAAQLDIGDLIVVGAGAHLGEEYEDVEQCSGLVRRAYRAAGICLDEWSNCVPHLQKKYNIAYVANVTNGVYIHREIAIKQNLLQDGGIRNHDPLIGDIVFFDDTSGPNHPLSHEGIIISGLYSDGTIQFIDATSSGVSIKQMNLEHPSDTTRNTALARRGCVRCYAGELFVGYGTIRNP